MCSSIQTIPVSVPVWKTLNVFMFLYAQSKSVVCILFLVITFCTLCKWICAGYTKAFPKRSTWSTAFLSVWLVTTFVSFKGISTWLKRILLGVRSSYSPFTKKRPGQMVTVVAICRAWPWRLHGGSEEVIKRELEEASRLSISSLQRSSSQQSPGRLVGPVIFAVYMTDKFLHGTAVLH